MPLFFAVNSEGMAERLAGLMLASDHTEGIYMYNLLSISHFPMLWGRSDRMEVGSTEKLVSPYQANDLSDG